MKSTPCILALVLLPGTPAAFALAPEPPPLTLPEGFDPTGRRLFIYPADAGLEEEGSPWRIATRWHLEGLQEALVCDFRMVPGVEPEPPV